MEASECSKEYPFMEFTRAADIPKIIPAVSAVMLRKWIEAGVYPAAIKRGKYWLVHPDQFKQWWLDGGPNPT